MAGEGAPRPHTTAAQRCLLFETWEATGKVDVAVRTAGVSLRTFYGWKPRFIEGGYAALECFDKRAPRLHTTAAQRRLLFETWQATGNVDVACQRAQVRNRTFHYWKPRFMAGGYDALECFKSCAPKRPRRTALLIEQQIIALYRQHPNWGSKRLASELASANDGVPPVCADTVKRILRRTGLWRPKRATKEAKQQVIALHQQHPDWGRWRLASELARANDGIPPVGDATVTRILRDAASRPGPARMEKREDLPA